jgi:hypothetical protein
MMLRVLMGNAALSSAQRDILEALGAAHQVHVCGFSDSEMTIRRRPDIALKGPVELHRGRRNRLPDIVAAIAELRNFPTFAAPGAVRVL